jgi:hypothetical protein
MKQVLILVFLIFAPIASAQTNPQIPGINQKNEATKIEKYTNLFDYRAIRDSVTENGFMLERRIKNSASREDKLEYAVMRKNGKNVLQLDRLQHPFGSVFFGAFPFLGKGAKPQLFAAQIAPRSGSHWIFDVNPKLEILFVSDDYNVGREDFQAIDLNADGVFELSFESLAFYNFEPERLGNAGVPLTEIVFKFDNTRRRFVPANPEFADYALRGVAEASARIRRDNKDFQLAGVLVVTLEYIYAGKESQGWAFFRENYQFADRDEIKGKVEAVLKTDPVYKFINRLQ